MQKNMCWSVKIVYVLVKLPDVSGPDLGEAGRYNLFSASSLLVHFTELAENYFSLKNCFVEFMVDSIKTLKALPNAHLVTSIHPIHQFIAQLLLARCEFFRRIKCSELVWTAGGPVNLPLFFTTQASKENGLCTLGPLSIMRSLPIKADLLLESLVGL